MERLGCTNQVFGLHSQTKNQVRTEINKKKQFEVISNFNHIKTHILGLNLDPPPLFLFPGRGGSVPPHARLQLQIGQAVRIAARGELLGQAEVETSGSEEVYGDFSMGKHGIFMGKKLDFHEKKGISIGKIWKHGEFQWEFPWEKWRFPISQCICLWDFCIFDGNLGGFPMENGEFAGISWKSHGFLGFYGIRWIR